MGRGGKSAALGPAAIWSTAGSLGKIGNCQVAVSSALIADGRTWPLAVDRYLPASWTDDPARRTAAGVPATVRVREKWRIALAQVRTVLQAGFTLTGVVVDTDYGTNAAFRAGLERLGLASGVAIRGEATCAVPGVPGTHTATALAASAPDAVWASVTWGTGTAGPLTARFCALRVRPTQARGERWLLCERSATDERNTISGISRGARRWATSWRSPAAAGRLNSRIENSKTTSASITSKGAPIRAGPTTSS